MKCDIPAPLERLGWFQNKLGLKAKDLEKLNPYRDAFVLKKVEFAEDFYQYFCEIPETKLVLDYKERQGHIRKAWAQWFESLFKDSFDERFLSYLWNSGLRHVESNVDQKFVNLGFSVVRRYCQEITKREVPAAKREEVLVVIDRMVDLCILIETQAYIEATSQCDLEVVKGISHQVRNPLTVIGGNILRLKKRADPDSPLHKTYETILGENKRLEAMVTDVAVYSEMFEIAAQFSEVSLESLLSGALQRLKATQWVENVKIEMDLSPEHPVVQGVPEDLQIMFYYLLQNSLEAVDPEAPYIKISSRLLVSAISFLEIEIFNNGVPPSKEDMENLFVPFYSSKPLGTGFGLPIAGLAARKSLGDLTLEPVPGQGTRCVIRLPIPLRTL
ncbi:MAG: protoglobin domain-containing protein [Desulfobacteraceae bacterium]|jgi:signal transduction histidine kinase